jgi:hypothetical protein
MKAQKGKKILFLKNKAKKGFFACLRNYKKRNGLFGQIKNKFITKKKIISHQSQKMDILSDLELLTKFLVFLLDVLGPTIFASVFEGFLATSFSFSSTIPPLPYF